jgi:hypothetical protein
MVDAHGCVIASNVDYTNRCILVCRYTYRRGLLRCSFNSNGQSRASNRGTSNSTDSTLFYVYLLGSV